MILSKFEIEDLFEIYKKNQKLTLEKHYKKIKVNTSEKDVLDFYFSQSAVYSSMIEGNTISFDTYLSYQASNMNTTGKQFQEIEDLKKAYIFAQNNILTIDNFLNAHAIASKTVLTEENYQGKVRDKNVFVFKEGKKIFTGASVEIVNNELIALFSIINEKLNQQISIDEAFFLASFIHLIFVQIHPFADGNGRMARLLEKWFLANALDARVWAIKSEKFYQKQIQKYYKNVHIGVDYESIDYFKGLSFLMMLPMALKEK